MADFQPSQLLWKRPIDVSFPQVWLRYETKIVNGKSYRVRIQEIEENRFEETLDFMDNYYNDTEPSSRAFRLSHDTVSLEETRKCRRRILEQKISIMAVLDEDVSTPKLLGCHLIYVESKDDLPLSRGCRGKFRQAMSHRSDVLHRKADAFEIFQSHEILTELGMIVAPEFQGFGVGFKMLSCWPIIAKNFKIPAAMFSITSAKVAKFAATIGFKTYAEFASSEYKNENHGQPIFSVDDPPCTYVGTKF